MTILEFKRPEAQEAPQVEEPQVEEETPIRMTAAEAAKVDYVAKKLDIPQLDKEVVKWPHQANATCKDLGFEIAPDGRILMRDDDLEEINRFDRRVKFYTRLIQVAFAVAGVALGFKLAAVLLGG